MTTKQKKIIAPVSVRAMTEEDYDQVYRLWRTIKGFGIRSMDDSKEGVARFLRRNPTTSMVAEANGELVGSILCVCQGRLQASGNWQGNGGLCDACIAKGADQ